MNLVIIGEAARHVSDDFLRRHPDVPWDEMQRMRNIVVHEYFGVSPRIVWETATLDVPSIVPAVKRILAELDRP